MIPLATWSTTRFGNEIQLSDDDNSWPEHNKPVLAQLEMSGLLDSIVENLMTASIVQLRSSLDLVGKRWVEQQALQHESHLTAELVKVEERIMAAVAEALLPVLTELQLREVMQEFASILQKLLPEMGNQSIVINAPEDMHGLLSDALKQKAIAAEISCSDSLDITMAANQVVMVANLNAWSEKLRAAAVS